jgi:hypothetical protein
LTNLSNEVLFVIAAKFMGEIREIVGFKINEKDEFFAFPPYARIPESVDLHSSKHLSGERHFKCRVGKKRQPMPENESTTSATLQFLWHRTVNEHVFSERTILKFAVSWHEQRRGNLPGFGFSRF